MQAELKLREVLTHCLARLTIGKLKNAPGFVTATLQLLAMQTDDTVKQAGTL
jgi:hypothetical protein